MTSENTPRDKLQAVRAEVARAVAGQAAAVTDRKSGA